MVDDEEAFLGLRCVAAPIRNSRNAIVAAVSVSGSRSDLAAEDLPELGDMVMAAAHGISARIGQRIHASREDSDLVISDVQSFDSPEPLTTP